MISLSIDNDIELETKIDLIKEIIDSEIEFVESFCDVEQIILRLIIRKNKNLDISELLFNYAKKLIKNNKTHEAFIVSFIIFI